MPKGSMPTVSMPTGSMPWSIAAVRTWAPIAFEDDAHGHRLDAHGHGPGLGLGIAFEDRGGDLPTVLGSGSDRLRASPGGARC
jgi:hypothetical protein